MRHCVWTRCLLSSRRNRNETRRRFAVPEQNPSPPSSPSPTPTIIHSRAVIGRAVHNRRRPVVAGCSVDDRRPAFRVLGLRTIGSGLSRRTRAQVSGDRIAALSIPTHRAPFADAIVDLDRASSRNGGDDLLVGSRSATQIDGGRDRGRPRGTWTSRRDRPRHCRRRTILRLRVWRPFLGGWR